MSTAGRIENDEDVGLAFLDVHQLLGVESLVGVRGVTHAILHVSILTYSASARATASSTTACRSRARADDNGCALSAKIVVVFNLSLEEATLI